MSSTLGQCYTHTHTHTAMLLTNGKAASVSNIKEEMINIHPVVYIISAADSSGLLSVPIQE